ncbi:1190_t:CDS:2, partial [Entrophospora sp. SA101]
MQQPEPIMNNVFLVDICIDKIYANDSSPLDIAKLGIKYFIQTEFHDSIHTFLEQLELLGPTDPAYYGSGLNIVFELLSLRRIVRNMDSPYRTEFHDSIHTFLEQLELLGPTDPAYYGSGLNIVFELLSLRRIVRNMDSPFRGNYVEHNETTNIFWFTDGKNMSWLNKDLTYQGSESQSPSATIYKTKFRWDQKLYIFLITQFQNPQNPITEIPPPSLDWINMVMRGK